MSDDQFTSVQWDREEQRPETREPTIVEEEAPPEYQREVPAVPENTTDSPLDSLLLAKEPAATEPIVADKKQQAVDIDHSTSVTKELTKDGDKLPAASTSTDQASPHLPPQQNESPPAIPQDTPDLFAVYPINTTVTAPIRDLDTSSKPYISYLLTTTTEHPSVLKLTSRKADQPQDTGSTTTTSATIEIRRRYGDFRFLHECLSNDFPTALIPPLPSKLNFKYLTGDTFSMEFVHKRLHSLNRFVKFILHHRELSQLLIFHLFISDSNDWANFTQNLKLKEISADEGSTTAGSGFVNKVVNEDLITETVMNFLTPSKYKRETNKDILEINDKLKKLYENLLKLDKIFVKLNKKNHDLSVDYDQFLTQILKLSAAQQESELDDAAILNDFKVFADSLTYFSNNWSNLHKYIDELFLVALKDCSKYIAGLTNLIELQHNKKIDLQVLQDYLNKARNELMSLGGGGGDHAAPNPVIHANQSGGLVNNTTQLIKDTLSTSATPHIGSAQTENKIHRLQVKIHQLEDEIATQTKLSTDLTSKIINDEYPNWDWFNRAELKEAILGVCDEEIKFYKGLVENWGEAEQKLVKRLEELSH